MAIAKLAKEQLIKQHESSQRFSPKGPISSLTGITLPKSVDTK